jgi:ABC-type uncharacterized transport system ATPase subunit
VTAEPILAGSGRSATASPDLAQPLLRTEKLTVRFGGLTALNGVDFSVPKGQVRAIIGPNGAGKSTFFNCVTGVLRPTSGAIFLAGDDITGLSPDRISRRGIARSYQITNILPNASVLENTRIAAQSRHHAWSLLSHHRAHRDIIEKAEAALDAVGLLGKADELAANLSHGEQRTLEIAIALATEPKLLCHRQGPHHPDRRARHAGGDGAGRPDHRVPLRRDPGRRRTGRDPAQSARHGSVPQDMSGA